MFFLKIAGLQNQVCSSFHKKGGETNKNPQKPVTPVVLEHSIRESSAFCFFFLHWMHKYNKALRSGLGCSSALWRNEGDWRCMCPGIGTGRDPSSPNYRHSRRPCGTLCLNIYMWLLPHPWVRCTHNPLHVTSCCAWYQWAILCVLASSGGK